jgi:hypothetical protein
VGVDKASQLSSAPSLPRKSTSLYRSSYKSIASPPHVLRQCHPYILLGVTGGYIVGVRVLFFRRRSIKATS